MPHGGQSDGVKTAGTYRCQSRMSVGASDLQLLFANWYRGASATETVPTNDITVTASVESPIGTYFQVTFGGKTSATINAGGQLLSDPVGVDLPAGTVFYVNTFVSVGSAGQKWPLTKYGVFADNEGNNAAAPGTDVTLTGLPGGNFGNGYIYTPSLIVGKPYPSNGELARIALVGDSELQGYQSQPAPYREDAGLVSLAPLKNYPVTMLAMFGEQAGVGGNGGFSVNTYRLRRAPLLAGITHAITDYGINDLAASKTAAQIEAGQAVIWGVLYNRGITAYQTTLMPQTTSTDSWATTGNQTVKSWESSRVAINTWLRAGAPLDPNALTPVAVGTSGAVTAPVYDGTGALVSAGSGTHYLAGVLEFADTVESARDSGLWKVTGSAYGYTCDGIHPSGQTTTGYASMTAAIPATAFTL